MTIQSLEHNRSRVESKLQKLLKAILKRNHAINHAEISLEVKDDNGSTGRSQFAPEAGCGKRGGYGSR
jgi:hypothetical protein